MSSCLLNFLLVVLVVGPDRMTFCGIVVVWHLPPLLVLLLLWSWLFEQAYEPDRRPFHDPICTIPV